MRRCRVLRNPCMRQEVGCHQRSCRMELRIKAIRQGAAVERRGHQAEPAEPNREQEG